MAGDLTRGVQLVWWWEWVGIGLTRDEGALGRVYRWRWRLGVFELRRWADESEESEAT